MVWHYCATVASGRVVSKMERLISSPEVTPVGPQLALIVGAARSGTTLLRLLMDAHPEIGCPAEAGIPALISHMARVWTTIHADTNEEMVVTDPGNPVADGAAGHANTVGAAEADGASLAKLPVPRLPAMARDWIRQATTAAMIPYCASGAKRLYVDKSLDSVFHLPLVDQAFPDVRCVLAFRHVMDTIASGIEASPWGFQAYGYSPYVQATPGNTVAALARYWLDHVTEALDWEGQQPNRCKRVRYEDLVSSPEQTVSELQAFLGVEANLGVLEAAFRREPARGPGDYKIEHTTAVHDRSVGHGKRVPITMIPPQLLAAINEKLDVLGYAPLDRSWNTVERANHKLNRTIWAAQLEALMAQFHPDFEIVDGGVYALLAEDSKALRWIIDTREASVNQGDGDVDGALIGAAQDLVLMLTGEENVGVLLRSGRVRYAIAEEDQRHGSCNYLREASELCGYLKQSFGDEANEPLNPAIRSRQRFSAATGDISDGTAIIAGDRNVVS